MYRDDRDAIDQRLRVVDRQNDDLRRQNQVMRHEIMAMRHSMRSYPPQEIYRMDLRYLSPAQRAALAHHTVQRFPVWAMALLHIITFGMFPLIHFGMLHDRLPNAAPNDPSSGKAIGFTFIPYYNLYWVFFNSLRLVDRLNLQLKLRGLPPAAPRGLMIACSIFTVIPYVNFIIGFPIMWTIGVCLLQSAVNKVAALDPLDVLDTLDPDAEARPV